MKFYISISVPMYDVTYATFSRNDVAWNDFNHVVVMINSEDVIFDHRRYEYSTDKGLVFSANQVHATMEDALHHVFGLPHDHPNGTWDNPWYLPGMKTC